MSHLEEVMEAYGGVFGDPRFRTDSEVAALACPSAETVCTVEESGVLRVWDVGGGLRSCCFLSNLETLWRFTRDARFLASAGRELCLWDVRAGELLSTHGQPDWVTALAFRGDGAAAPADLVLATGDDRGAIRVWTQGGECLCRTLAGHGQALSALAFSPEGARLASAAEDQTVYVWDLPTGRVLWQGTAHTDRVVDLVWHPDGRYLVSTSWDVTLRVWDTTSGESACLPGPSATPVNAVALSPDGRLLVAADAAGLVRVWGWAGRTVQRTVEVGTEITALAFSPCGATLAAAGADRLVRVLECGQLAPRVAGHSRSECPTFGPQASPSAFAPSGFRRNWNSLAVAGGGRLAEIGARTCVRLWSDANEPVLLKPDIATVLHAVAGSRDGRLVAAGGEAGEVYLWDAATATLLETLENEDSSEPITALTFSPDGAALAAASARGTFIQLWHLRGDAPAWLFANALDGCTVEALAFSLCGRFLAAGGIDWLATGGSDGLALVWELPAWREVAAFENGSTAVAFHPSGGRVASAGLDSILRIWDVATRDVLYELSGPRGIVTGLAFSPDGRRLATGGDDRFLRVWDTARGNLCLQVELDSEIKTLAYSPDGRFLFTANANGASYQLDVAKLEHGTP